MTRYDHLEIIRKKHDKRIIDELSKVVMDYHPGCSSGSGILDYRVKDVLSVTENERNIEFDYIVEVDVPYDGNPSFVERYRIEASVNKEYDDFQLIYISCYYVNDIPCISKKP